MAVQSLRPDILRVMMAHRGRPLSTIEIYELVAEVGIAGYDPVSKRDRNLVNRELSDLAGCSSGAHSRETPQVLQRVGRGRYIFREPERPLDLLLLESWVEVAEVYVKRPPRRRGSGRSRAHLSEQLRTALFSVQRGLCPGCGIYLPHHLRFDLDHVLALADDGEDVVENLQLLCGYCNRVKGSRGSGGRRLTMAELRAANEDVGVMVDAGQAVLTGKRLAQYHGLARRGPGGMTGSS